MSERHFVSRVISKETIKPSSPTPPHLKTYDLSLFDKLSPKIHIPFVFFYPNDGSFSNTVTARHLEERLTTCQSLKKSLSQTLSQYYPFSGRLTAENRSYVDCNDEGVEFVEAHIDATLSEFVCVNSFENHQLRQDELCPTIYKDPSHLVIVQLSYFACGGLVLAVSISHKIADACTFFSFVNHWATVTRQNSGDQQALPLSPHFIYSSNDILDHIPKYAEKDKGNNLVTKNFVFPNSKLAKLKAKAKEAAEEEEELAEMAVRNPTTRNEVLSSLLYGCAVRAAKKVNSQSVDTFAMAQLVNLRKRMVEPLPETAVGNIWYFFMIPTVTESEMALSHLTARIKKEKMQLTELTRSLVISKWLAALKTLSASDKAIEIYVFSSLCGFPLYQVDFGWGKPVQVNTTDWFLGKNHFFLMDTPSGDGIQVVLTLEEENMVAFQNDEQLLAFAL